MELGKSGYTDIANTEFKIFKITPSQQVQFEGAEADVSINVTKQNVHSTEPVTWFYKKAGKWNPLPIHLNSDGEEMDLAPDYGTLTVPKDYQIWSTSVSIRAELHDVDGNLYYDETTLYRLGDKTGVQIILDNEFAHLRRNKNKQFNLSDLVFNYSVYNNKTKLVEGENENQFTMKHTFAEGVVSKSGNVISVMSLTNTFSNELEMRLSFTVSVLGEKNTIRTAYFNILNHTVGFKPYISDESPTLVYDEKGTPKPLPISIGLVKDGVYAPLESYTLATEALDGVAGNLVKGADKYTYTITNMTADAGTLKFSFSSDGGDLAVKTIPVKRKATSVPVLTYSTNPSSLVFNYNSKKVISEEYQKIQVKLTYGKESLFGNSLVEKLDLKTTASSSVRVNGGISSTGEISVTLLNNEIISADKTSGYFLEVHGSIKLKGDAEVPLYRKVAISAQQSITVMDEVDEAIKDANIAIGKEFEDRVIAVNDAILKAETDAIELKKQIDLEIEADWKEWDDTWVAANITIDGKITTTNDRITTEIGNRETAVSNAISTATANAEGFANAVQDNLESLANADTTYKIHGNAMVTGTLGADKIVANSITAGQIKAGSITANLIQSDAIVTDVIKAGAITAEKVTFNDAFVTSLTAVSLFSTKIQAIDLIADRIKTGTLNADLIKVNSLKGDRILAGSITADKIKANSITSGQIDAASIKAVILTADAVDANTLKVDQALINKLTVNDLLVNAITAKSAFITSVQTISLNADYIKAGTLHADRIAAGSIEINKLKNTDKDGGVASYSKLIATEKNITLGVGQSSGYIGAIPSGEMLYRDETFKDSSYYSGTNNVNAYNNGTSGAVAVVRVSRPSDAPTKSTHIMEVRTTGAAAPGHGGFWQPINSRANAIFVQRIIAKVPTGRTLQHASNSIGTGGEKHFFVGSNEGTGRYETYYIVRKCGSGGSFSTSGHIYLSGGSYPVTWHIASATVIDITNTKLQDFIEETKVSLSPQNITLAVSSNINGGASMDTTSLKIEKNMVTIKNGNFQILNSGGTAKLYANTAGELIVASSIQVGGSANGQIVVKNSSNSDIAVINNKGIVGRQTKIGSTSKGFDDYWSQLQVNGGESSLYHQEVKSLYSWVVGSVRHNRSVTIDTSGAEALSISSSFETNKITCSTSTGITIYDGKGSTVVGAKGISINGNPAMSTQHLNGYHGMLANGDASNWIRTTVNGLIPYQSGGHGSLGTGSWPFANIYANTYYQGGTRIVEYGANSNGSYTKYADGTLICYKSIGHNMTTSGSWGSTFATGQPLALGGTPFKFVGDYRTVVFMSGRADNAKFSAAVMRSGAAGYVNQSGTDFGKGVELLRGTSMGTQNFYLDIIGIGRWK